MPLTRAQRLRKRRLEATRPTEDIGGLYIYDGNNGYDFLSWEEVEAACRGTMNTPEYFAAQEYGKMHYKSDPTYEMRRRR